MEVDTQGIEVGGGSREKVQSVSECPLIRRRFGCGSKPGPKYKGKPLSDWVNQCKDKDKQTRLDAVKAVALFGREANSAIPTLTELLKDPDREVRVVAAQARLFGREAKTAVPALMEFLKDKDLFVRTNAAHTLSSIGPDFPALMELLKDKDANVRAAALWPLETLVPRGRPPS